MSCKYWYFTWIDPKMDTSPTASISAWASISLADAGHHACEMQDEVEVQSRLVILQETRLRCEVLLWSRLIHLACGGRLEKRGALQHIEVNSPRMETTNRLRVWDLAASTGQRAALQTHSHGGLLMAESAPCVNVNACLLANESAAVLFLFYFNDSIQLSKTKPILLSPSQKSNI